MFIHGELHSYTTSTPNQKVHLILRLILTRELPRKPDYICAIKKNGGRSKSFPNEKELTGVDSQQIKNNWKVQVSLIDRDMVPRSTITSFINGAFEKKFIDLSSQYSHQTERIGT